MSEPTPRIVGYPKASYLAHRAEIDAAIARVLERGTYILGDEVAAFESEFAAYLGATACASVANGTDAVELALRACGLGDGAVVIAPSFTAVAAVAAIEAAGARPLLVDVDPITMTIDVAQTELALERCQREGESRVGVLAVHLFGCPADLTSLLPLITRFGAILVEDCAQAHGASVDGRKVGTWGSAAAFSFYPTKNLAALGDGGAVVSMDAQVIERVKRLRQYGWVTRNVSETVGFNSRLDELQAAVLRVKLLALDAENERRRAIALRYSAALRLGRIICPSVPEGRSHVFHQYVVRTAQRDDLRAFLQGHGIPAVVHYPVAAHDQPAYRDRLSVTGTLAESSRSADTVLSLPMSPHMTDADVDEIAWLVMKHVGPAPRGV